MNGGPANEVFGELGLHIFGDPLFWTITALLAVVLCITACIGYYFGRLIERMIDYVQGDSDQDGREDRQDDQQSPTIGYTAQVQSGRRFGDRQDSRTPMYSFGEGRTET